MNAPNDPCPFSKAFDRLAALYAALAAELAAGAGEAGPGAGSSCRACGECCHFEAVEHTLFASELEWAYARAVAGAPPTGPAQAAKAAASARCPYQVDGRCLAHRARPLGCRLYFCAAPSDGDDARAERHHRALKAIHDDCAIPWDYRPWLARFL